MLQNILLLRVPVLFFRVPCGIVYHDLQVELISCVDGAALDKRIRLLDAILRLEVAPMNRVGKAPKVSGDVDVRAENG